MVSGRAISHHLYTDDRQRNVSCVSRDTATALNSFQSCLASAQSWTSMNKLKLKPDKTELLLIGNERQSLIFPIEILGVKTNPSNSAGNVGVIFDKTFTFYSHLSPVCISWFYHIRDLRLIRRYLDLDNYLQNYLQMPLLCLAVSIIINRFWQVLRTLTSPNFNVVRIDWPAFWRSHFHLVALFHCLLPFIG